MKRAVGTLILATLFGCNAPQTDDAFENSSGPATLVVDSTTQSISDKELKATVQYHVTAPTWLGAKTVITGLEDQAESGFSGGTESKKKGFAILSVTPERGKNLIDSPTVIVTHSISDQVTGSQAAVKNPFFGLKQERAWITTNSSGPVLCRFSPNIAIKPSKEIASIELVVQPVDKDKEIGKD
jgi:hypothetical protein